jgi:hypothetical protein
MQHSDSINAIQLNHNKQKRLNITIQSNNIKGDLFSEKQDRKKQNIFADLLSFLSVGFGVSNVDSIESDYDDLR